ncbi:hypothetical protein BC829DRAFT_399167 [Chytridium lagenaria]|nr:hypothetical protein BC829DRAFT_399167 [Chytridium lagenaria]
MKGFILLLVLAFAVVAQCGLIVNKVVKEKNIITGRNATISITRPSATSLRSPALSGKHSAKFASIEPNANVSFSFVVKPIVAGVLPDHPAIYKYQVDKDYRVKLRPPLMCSDRYYRAGYSASLASITVLTEQEAARLETHVVQWSVFFVASALACFVPFYLFSSSDSLLNQTLKKEKTA